MFMNDLGHSWLTTEDSCDGSLGVIDELCVPGTQRLRTGVLASVADMVSGSIANRSCAPRIPLTVDLALHAWRPVTGGQVTMSARTLKAGRTIIFTEATFSDADGLMAVCNATFVPSPLPDDVMEKVFWHRPETPAAIDGPIFDAIGVVEVAKGVVELPRAKYVLQPSGTIQGGAIALLAEAAAASASDAVITELELRYLSTVRVGPARAAGTVIGPGVVRVEIRDAGGDDRLATLAVARY
jgi:acyl-coenzyme A thioesterase PaaI-like protein